MTKAASIYRFWASFGLPAYEENSVPDDAEFPYLTYQLITDSFGYEVSATASLWYRSESWISINSKTDEISESIGRGILSDCDGGKIWIKRGRPFAQNLGDESDTLIKRKYLNITIEYMTND